MTNGCSGVVKRVLELHYRSLKVMTQKVGVHYGNSRVMKLDVGLHYGRFSVTIEVLE